MSTKQFLITEVFAENPYGGNQLATLLDAADMSTQAMQKVARAFNFAETTFFVGGNEADGFDVRIFTPETELPFAGHPTLGSAWLAREVVAGKPLNEVVLNLGVGKIPVTFGEDDVLWMRQKAPVFGNSVDRASVARTLGLSADDLSDEFPCQYVSTGLEFLMVPLTSMNALKSIRITNDDFGHGLLAFCPEGYDEGQQIGARMFALSLGVSEDAATGSANGCLAAYLVENRYFGVDAVDVRVGQGYEIGRPSQLYLRSKRTAGTIEVNVGGKVNLVARGEWLAQVP